MTRDDLKRRVDSFPKEYRVFLAWDICKDAKEGVAIYERATLLRSKPGGGFVTYISSETDMAFLAYILGTVPKDGRFMALLERVKEKKVVPITPGMFAAMTLDVNTYDSTVKLEWDNDSEGSQTA